MKRNNESEGGMYISEDGRDGGVIPPAKFAAEFVQVVLELESKRNPNAVRRPLMNKPIPGQDASPHSASSAPQR